MRILAISDIHFGLQNNIESLYQQIDKLFFSYIQKDPPDLIVVCGDDTDCRLSLNQLVARYYLMFVNRLAHMKKLDGSPIPIRFVSGTDSHQKNQLGAFTYLTMNTDVNVRIYETVGEEIIDGVRCLFIPEEPVIDKNEYYREYFSKEYDFCFGHGMFSFVSAGYGEQQESSLKQSPTFEYDDFKNVIKQLVIFGHIHISQLYKNFIIYPGSFSRDSYGEESAKGFLDIYYDIVKQKSKFKFVENIYAPKYDSIRLDKVDSNIEEWINNILVYKNSNLIYKLRIILCDIEPVTVKIIQTYFRNNRHLNIDIRVNKTTETGEEKNEIVEDEEDSSTSTTYSNPLDFMGNTVMYAQEVYNELFTTEEVTEILVEARSL